MKRVVKALMSRGVDSALAQKLANDGWTIGKLQSERQQQLEQLGLPQIAIVAILQKSRPPIPEPTLVKVLHANRYQCCACRDPSKPIIVHHIDEWSKSKSHDESNLAVLCLEHHARAHTTGTLERNLTVSRVKSAKALWEGTVKAVDTQAVLAATRLEQVNWNYINELRVLEIAKALGIRPKNLANYHGAVSAGLIDPDGTPRPTDGKGFYLYDGGTILQRYFYMSQLLGAVLAKMTIINLSDHFDADLVLPVLLPGDVIVVVGKHVFSPLNERREGKGQDCRAVRRANRVAVEYVFDRWEATSSSAKNIWLSGTRSAASVLQVKDIAREEGTVIVRGTALGVASGMDSLKTRDYAPRWQGYWPANSGGFWADFEANNEDGEE